MKSVHDGIISLKNLFSTLKALMNQKRLFTSVPNLSTQGNSIGQVNDPKVMSEGLFICGDCDQVFPNEDDVMNHKREAHDKANAADFICDGCEQRFSTEEELVEHKRDIHDNANAADTNIVDNVDNDLNIDEENDHDMAKLVEEYEEDMLVKELERMSKIDNTVSSVASKCQECSNVKEVLAHKVISLNNKDKRIKTMETRQKKTDEKKNELVKEKKKLAEENSALKTELRKSNNMLAEQLKKVSALKVELETREGIAEIYDSNQEIKCGSCSFNARNPGLLKDHMEIEHTFIVRTDHICQACSKKFKNNDDLELPVVEEHEDEADCSKCNAFF